MRKAKSSAAGRSRGPARAVRAVSGEGQGVRPGTKLQTIVGLLKRPKGCTRTEAMKAVDWPSISLQQQAAAAGLKLRKEKVDGKNRYFAR